MLLISPDRGLFGELEGVGGGLSPVPEFSPGDGDGLSPPSPGLGEAPEPSLGLGVGDSPAPR
ncbi:MAG: hypothetical protein DME42_01610 [Verrucomicrobia bacterium]|nr:MAG: hypothetical protein DME42_01610 [Verrucomicrobiota bacterium]